MVKRFDKEEMERYMKAASNKIQEWSSSTSELQVIQGPVSLMGREGTMQDIPALDTQDLVCLENAPPNWIDNCRSEERLEREYANNAISREELDRELLRFDGCVVGDPLGKDSLSLEDLKQSGIVGLYRSDPEQS